MADYDFTGLSPSDFESLSRDTLARALGVQLQAFTSGPDRGIDLRHARAGCEDWIVQCKHFARSGFAKLRSHLQQREVPKIERLKPGRYILATSVGLTPDNVDDLFELLSPFCRDKHDIFGRDDLNAILRANPAIEQAHFKLWLTSEAVLSRVLHNDVFVRSWLTQEEISQRLFLYVYTDAFNRARTQLEKERVCILSGVPGVGKTTLAEMLLVEFLMTDWEIISIQQNVSEGQRAFRSDPDAKQVFYYDDFLGQITKGDKLGKNEDRALLQLIAAVARNGNKRFILTTREYILAQAKSEHEQLARSNIDLYRFVVKCEEYNELDKARILANHLYFARVPQEHIAAMVEGRSYRAIISHRNYNPRIIEWMTGMAETTACKADEYPKVFLDRLEDPSKLWTHAFERQITESSRNVLLVLGTCGDTILLDDLRRPFEQFHLYRATKYGFSATPSDFENSLDELEGNFIRIEPNDSELVVRCHNPSILDFVNQRLLGRPADSNDLLRCATGFEQVERLFELFRYGARRSDALQEVFSKPAEVAAAIERTLLAGSVRLSQRGLHDSRWFRRSANVWDRLCTCCRIGSAIPDSELRGAVEGHIGAHVASMVTGFGELSDITRLLEVADGCMWLDWRIRSAWHDSLHELLLSKDDEFDETLEGLSAAAKWLRGNQYRFRGDQVSTLTKNLSSAVRREIEDNSDTSDPDRLGGDLAAVQEIAKALDLAFEKEERWLSEKLGECEARGSKNSVGTRTENRAAGCTSSIESLFEALLEQ